MRIIATAILFLCLLTAGRSQVFFKGDVHQVDLDIMEKNSTCFQSFTEQQIDFLLIFDQAIRMYDLREEYKLTAVFQDKACKGIYFVIDKMYYQVLPATVETFSDLPQKRFLLMNHYRDGHFQLTQMEETLKNGVSFELIPNTFKVLKYRNGLPAGKQAYYSLIDDNHTFNTVDIVVLNGSAQQMFADTIEVLNPGTNLMEGFISERSDSTSVIRQ